MKKQSLFFAVFLVLFSTFVFAADCITFAPNFQAQHVIHPWWCGTAETASSFKTVLDSCCSAYGGGSCGIDWDCSSQIDPNGPHLIYFPPSATIFYGDNIRPWHKFVTYVYSPSDQDVNLLLSVGDSLQLFVFDSADSEIFRSKKVGGKKWGEYNSLSVSFQAGWNRVEAYLYDDWSFVNSDYYLDIRLASGYLIDTFGGVHAYGGVDLDPDNSPALCSSTGGSWSDNVPSADRCCGDDPDDDEKSHAPWVCLGKRWLSPTQDEDVCVAAGAAWDDDFGCCGDLPFLQSGLVLKRGEKAPVICVNDSGGGYGHLDGNWHWLFADDVFGHVFHTKDDYAVLSDGDTWLACDADSDGSKNFANGKVLLAGDSWPAPFDNPDGANDFLCFSDHGSERFAECIGDKPDGQWWNKNYPHYGEVFQTGDSISSSQFTFSTVEKFSVIPNSASGKSCDELCAESGDLCVDVGLDVAATNNQFLRQSSEPGDPVCVFDPSATCSTVMIPDPVKDSCDQDVYSTNCRCQTDKIPVTFSVVGRGVAKTDFRTIFYMEDNIFVFNRDGVSPSASKNSWRDSANLQYYHSGICNDDVGVLPRDYSIEVKQGDRLKIYAGDDECKLGGNCFELCGSKVYIKKGTVLRTIDCDGNLVFTPRCHSLCKGFSCVGYCEDTEVQLEKHDLVEKSFSSTGSVDPNLPSWQDLGVFDAYPDNAIDVVYKLSGSVPFVQLSFSPDFVVTTTTDPDAHVYAKPAQLGETFYCTSDSEWLRDLDSADDHTCQSFGFDWTGSMCCGDDLGDSYNDNGWQGIPGVDESEVGGCFQNLKVSHNSLVSDINLIRNGDFGRDNWVPWVGDAKLDMQFELVELRQDQGLSQDVSEYLLPLEYYVLSANISSSNSESYVSFVANNEVIASLETDGHGVFSTVFKTPVDVSDAVVELGVSGQGKGFFDGVSLKFFNKSILNFDGSFYGCNLPDKVRFNYYDTDSSLLINETDNSFSCTSLGDYFCSPGGDWQLSSVGAPQGTVRNTSKSTPYELDQSFSCCASDQCWNGEVCVPSEADQPVNPIIVGRRVWQCLDGEWVVSVNQSSWDGSSFGFCRQESQCLVDPDGDPANNGLPELFRGFPNSSNPQCIGDDQFVGDHFCDDGNWTSRTKLLAVQLLNITLRDNPGSYVLYCDHYPMALPSFNYSLTSNIQDLLRGTFVRSAPPGVLVEDLPWQCDSDTPFECVNNFCVLQIEDQQPIFAVSLNKPVDDPDSSFLKALGLASDVCNKFRGLGAGFSECPLGPGSSGEMFVFYADSINSVIFSKTNISSSFGPPSAWQSFKLFVSSFFGAEFADVNRLKALVRYASDNPLRGVTSLDYLLDQSFNRTKDFNRIFVAKKGDKILQSVIEQPSPGKEFLAIEYRNFDTDVCSSVFNYALAQKQLHPGVAGDSNCTRVDDRTFYVVSYQQELLGSWPDFTSRLRIRD